MKCVLLLCVVLVGVVTGCWRGDPCKKVRIISRADWGSKNPKSTSSLRRPTYNVIIHHTVTQSCNSQSACSARVRSIQNYHMNTMGWADIGYNFLVGEDGNAYEGRGWDRQGAHAKGWNAKSHGIAVIGDFSNRQPNQKAITTLGNLITCGFSKEKISLNYKIRGHRNVGSTSCPGNALYQWVASRGAHA